jgi:hypothetical protein
MWINPVEIKSETSSRKYTVSELVIMGIPTGTYGCSCPGWKAYGKCKHLTAMHLRSAREPTIPAPKGLGKSDNSTFQDEAYDHYDPYLSRPGSSSEWLQLAGQLRGGRVKVNLSDDQWDEIFLLVDTRLMTTGNMRFLDEWVRGEGDADADMIIGWLSTLPVR